MNAHRSQEHWTREHWTDAQLLDRLYGSDAPAPLQNQADHDQHLESCAKCAVRWRELQVRRKMVVNQATADPPVSDQFLAAQRARIYARLEDEPRKRRIWVPAAVAAMCVLAVGLFLHRSVTPPPADVADAQLFADVYSMEQSVEPQAAVTIHALFEEGQ